MPSSSNHETFDVGKQEVGLLYARALVAAAQDAGQTAAVLDELDSLVDDVLTPNPRFEDVLASGIITPEQKIGVIDRTFGGRASALLLNFLKVLAEQGRLDALRAIRTAAHRVYDEIRHRVRVEVTTAVPLDEGLASRLVVQLRGMVGGDPQLVRLVDPALVGGLMVRVGDTVYDGSIASRLQNIRSQMINRSVHEIQSRRDRFSSPEGN